MFAKGWELQSILFHPLVLLAIKRAVCYLVLSNITNPGSITGRNEWSNGRVEGLLAGATRRRKH